MILHLKYKELIGSFKDIDVFKYAAYRMALKVQRFQTTCKLHLIGLNSISNALDGQYHGSDNWIIINIKDCESLICTLYDNCQADETMIITDIFLSFLSSAFCGWNSVGSIYLYELKIVLALFSAAKLRDKHRYFFQQFSSGGCITTTKVKLLLECLAKVAEAFGEKLSFGSSFICATVQSCKQFNQGYENVLEAKFLDWLFCEPQSLVWLSTNYRLSVSDKSLHNVKCNVCKIYPFHGMRYKCLCCFGYNLCQQCFLRGFANLGHESDHLVHEFCKPITPWNEVKALLKTFKNKLLCTKKLKQNFLMFKNSSSGSKLNSESDNICTLLDPSSEDLLNIVEKLEEETRRIGTEINQLEIESKGEITSTGLFKASRGLENWIKSKRELLQKHHHCIQLQQNRLKQHILNSKNPVHKDGHASEKLDILHSPSLKFIEFECNEQFESTPLSSDNRNPTLFIPRNLSKFIKLHAELDGVMNLSKSTSSMQPVAYSIADIEMDTPTVSTTNFETKHISNIKCSDRMKLHTDELLDGKSDTCQAHVFCSLESFASSKVNTLHSNCLYLPHDSKNYMKPQAVLSKLVPSPNASIILSLSQSQHSLDCSSSSNDFSELCPLSSMKSSLKNLAADSDEFFETELQKILGHLESLHLKVADLQNDIPAENNELFYALTEMEEALQKLSTTVPEKNM